MDIKRINKIVKTDIKEGLKEIYPEVFEDIKINFEKLKALLSGEIIEKEDDRFYFNWAGKSKIFKLIQTPAYGTLKPDKERSIDFDKTENIAIIGENLETLKLLLKPYFGKVKMIYIDPPYNTGKDKIYRDNFKEPVRDYLEKTGQIDSDGNKLITNTEASGRYHSDWLNFIYPRLFLARNLLRDDGVIFISIDDNEVHHLRMIMDEIFGEENFVCNLIWEKKYSPANDAKWISDNHDHILLFAKSKQNFTRNLLPRTIEMDERYKNYDNDQRGPWKPGGLSAKTYSKKYDYPVKTPSGKIVEPPKGSCWQVTKERLEELIKDNRIYFGKNNDSKPQIKQFLSEVQKGIVPKSIWLHNEVGHNQVSRKEIVDLFDEYVFDTPKPTKLIKRMLEISTSNNAIILDFFAGSGTTGQAVWDLNKEDGGNRKFILIQLDEEVLDEKIKKEFPTIADICIERLRRVSEKYKREIASSPVAPRNDEKGITTVATDDLAMTSNHDFGFKVFRLDKSNFNLKDEFEMKAGEDVEELKKKYLEWLGIWIDEPLVGGWQKIDVVFEIILKEGLNLNSKIEEVRIKNNNFYYVKDAEQNLDFYISLEDKINKEAIEEIRTTKYKNKIFIFMDKALTDDDKINLTSFARLKVI